jgi:exo beta-1,2-glucooligosaccharide sophorohydrolase (non-reducing end)
LPRIQLRDGEGSFTAPLGLERVTETIPARQWIQVRLPLREFSNASIHPFEPNRIQSVFFLQGTADETDHTLIVDEVKIDIADLGDQAPPAAPQALLAKGYDRHIDLSWQPNTERDLERYIIFRSFDGRRYEPIGIQDPRFNRYTDFLGKQNQQAFYRIAASDRGYHRSVTAHCIRLDDRQS